MSLCIFKILFTDRKPIHRRCGCLTKVPEREKIVVLICTFMKKFGQLKLVNVFLPSEEKITGKEFLERARRLTNGNADQEAFLFYSKPANQHLISGKSEDGLGSDTQTIVFVDDESDEAISYLIQGRKWIPYQYYEPIDSRKGRHMLVAVPIIKEGS